MCEVPPQGNLPFFFKVRVNLSLRSSITYPDLVKRGQACTGVLICNPKPSSLNEFLERSL